jgi:hypothetical protein
MAQRSRVGRPTFSLCASVHLAIAANGNVCVPDGYCKVRKNGVNNNRGQRHSLDLGHGEESGFCENRGDMCEYVAQRIDSVCDYAQNAARAVF